MVTDSDRRRAFDDPRYVVVLSFGSNLGRSEQLLAWAVAQARATCPQIAVSGLYSTPPWGPVEQPDFRNVTLVVESTMTPRQWLLWGNRLEALALRRREVRWGPRTLDVDIVAAAWIDPDGEHQPMRADDPELILPHPRAAVRAFVLVPWLEIEPYARLAGTPLTTLIDALPAADRDGIRRLGDVPVVDPDSEPPIDEEIPSHEEPEAD